jgi:predicted peroxiredoxin
MLKMVMASAASLAFVAFAGLGSVKAQQATSPAAKPGLFVNLASDDTWRGWMALHFAWRTQQQGHPTTVFLNLEGARWAWSKLPTRTIDNVGTQPQAALANLIKDGGTVLVSQPALQRLGIPESELVPGVKMAAPGLTQSLMFKDGTRIISW